MQILQRLFPFKRGLTHAYWAPNFWALYNFIDFVLYKICSVSILKKWLSGYGFVIVSPRYTRGLVLEYDHSVLPNVNATMTLLLTVFFCIPIPLILRRKDIDVPAKFLITLTLSAYAFFFFGWHVHEKALLMVFFPMLFLVFKDMRYLDAFQLCFSTIFSCFPLFFTPLENLLKHGLGFGYLIVHVSSFYYIFKLSIWGNLRSNTNAIYLFVLASLEAYYSFFHKFIFGDQVSFLPLIIFSVLCALGVLASYVQLLFILFGNVLRIFWLKKRCETREREFLRNCLLSSSVKHSTTVSLVAGVDISTCPDEPNLVIASITVLKLPEFSIVNTMDMVTVLSVPYIPEYLAIREAPVMFDLINSFVCKTKIKPDVVFIDGNGMFHSRCCGLAVHVGYLAMVKSVGVAKTFNGFPLCSFGYSESETYQLNKEIGQMSRKIKSASVLELGLTEPSLLNVLCQKSEPFFISAGFNTTLDEATDLSAKCLFATPANPIRLSDLRSRALLQLFYQS